MHQEEIKDGNLLIAKIIRSSVWPEGLMFYSQPDYSKIGKTIKFSDTLRNAKKYTDIDDALL